MPATTNLPNGFKLTPLGSLPTNWEISRIDNLFSIQQGKAVGPKSRIGQSPRPFLRTGNVLWGRTDLATLDSMDFTESEEQRLALQARDLLVCEGGEIGRTALWRGEIPNCYYQNHIHRLRPRREDVEPEFYMYWMQAALLHLGLYAGEGNKTTIPNLSRARLGSFLVPHPPLPEQRAIAAVLRAVQRARDATDAVIAAAQHLKQSLMRYVYTYGHVPIQDAARVPTKETEVGTLPEAWQIRELGTLLREPLRNGHSAREALSGDGVRTLTLSAVTRGDFSIANTKVTVADPQRVADLWLRAGDIFVERANTRELVGLTALYDGPDDFAIFPDLLVRLRFDESKIVPRYALRYLQTRPCRTYFSQNARGTAESMPKIDHRIISQLRLPIPRRHEQESIAHVFDVIDAKITVEGSRRRTLDTVFATLLRNLMTGTLRVADIAEVEHATG